MGQRREREHDCFVARYALLISLDCLTVCCIVAIDKHVCEEEVKAKEQLLVYILNYICSYIKMDFY